MEIELPYSSGELDRSEGGKIESLIQASQVPHPDPVARRRLTYISETASSR